MALNGDPVVTVGTDGTWHFAYDTGSGSGTIYTATSTDGGVTWSSSEGGEWMAHPPTAKEIIDEHARKLARLRPAGVDD